MLKGKQSGAVSGVTITDEVITAIVTKEAEAVEGVAALVPCPKKGAFSSGKKSVIIASDGDEIALCVCLKVKRGRAIPQIAYEVRECVKAAVEGITGRTVTRVDVTVAGIDLS